MNSSKHQWAVPLAARRAEDSGYGHVCLEVRLNAGRNAVIYVVEHDEAVRDALATLLESIGYEVEAFGTASDFLRAHRPGVQGCLLVDLDLPEMDGPELIGILVARRIKLPAVLMSGRMRNRRLQRHLPPGVVAILEKPFGDHELLERIEFALGKPRTH
ncbi:MAG: response regulator [Pseudomonadota bacterium]